MTQTLCSDDYFLYELGNPKDLSQIQLPSADDLDLWSTILPMKDKTKQFKETMS